MTRLRPTTRPGHWAVGLAAGALACLLALLLLTAAGQRGGDTFSDNWALAAPGLLGATLAAAAFGAALWAVARAKERAALPLAVLVLGGLAVLFLLGEALGPH